MAEATLSVTPATTSVAVALGTVRDAEGNATTADPIASGSFSVTDSALASIATPDGLSTVITLTAAEGTFEVDFAGTTTAGVAVTGKGSITVAAGVPATVDLSLTAQ